MFLNFASAVVGVMLDLSVIAIHTLSVLYFSLFFTVPVKKPSILGCFVHDFFVVDYSHV